MKHLLAIIVAAVGVVTVMAQGTLVAQYPDPARPEVSLASDWTYGFYGGIGYHTPLGSLHDNFGSSLMFQLGLTGGYKKFRVKADIGYGQPSLKNHNIFNVPDSAGYQKQGNSNASASHLLAGVQVGYVVWQGEKVSVTPNIGIHYNGYNWDVENYSWAQEDKEILIRHITGVEHRSLRNWNWIASVDIDFRLQSHINQQPLLGGGNRERFTSWIRLTPWISRSAFDKCDPAVSGCNFGVSVSYFGLGRFLGER